MTLDTLTRCAYCGDVCEGDRLDDWGEPVCDECRAQALADDYADDERERLWEIAHDA